MFARVKVNFPSSEGVKLVCWLCSYACNQSVEHGSKMIICKFPSSWRKSLESFFDLHQGWNLLGEKFLTIVMSLNDIDRGLDVCRKLSFYLLSHNR